MNQSALRLFVRSIIAEAKEKKADKKDDKKSTEKPTEKKAKKSSGNLVEMKKELASLKDELAKIDETIKDWESVKSAAEGMKYGGEQDIEIGADKQEEILKDCDTTIERLKKEKESIEKDMASLKENTASEINKIKEMMGLVPEGGKKKMVDEKKKMTPAQKEKKEDIVKGMKKEKGDFEKRYGKKEGEGVMYATATKLAKGKKK